MEDVPGGGADGASHVIARLDAASRATPGQEADLVLDVSKLKLFALDDGRNLTQAS